MYLLRDYHDRVARFICSRSRAAFALAWGTLIAAMGLLFAVFTWMGSPPMNGLPWDTSLVIEGAWRIFNGQVPHKDFYVYIGTLHYYMAALGMKLGHPGISSIVWGNLFIMAATGLSAMLILQRRTSASYALLFSLFISVLIVAPRALGESHDATGYAMLYNRYGEAFVALLAAILFLRPLGESNKTWPEWVEAAFAGFCVPALLFCKINYCTIGIGFLGVSIIMRRFSVKTAIFSVVSAAFFFVLAFKATGIPPDGLWRDLRIMAATQTFGSRLPHMASEVVRNMLPLLILLGFVFEVGRGEKSRQKRLGHFFTVLLLCGAALALVSSNSQTGELPLAAFAALYCAEMIRRQPQDPTEGGFFTLARNGCGALVFLLFTTAILGEDAASIRYAARIKSGHDYTTPEALKGTRLDDWYFCTEGSRKEEMKNFMETLGEGTRMLRQQIHPPDNFNVFMFCDPYHLALGLPPARGGVNCWAWIGMTERSHPPLDRLIGNARYILTGAGPDLRDDYGAECRPVYGTEWDDVHFQTVEQTKHLTLLRVPVPPRP
jgi:hypothetical protein